MSDLVGTPFFSRAKAQRKFVLFVNYPSRFSDFAIIALQEIRSFFSPNFRIT